MRHRLVKHMTLGLALLLNAGVAEETVRPASPTRWALDGGLGIRFWDNGNRSQEEREYLNQARVGAVGALEVSVFPWENLGAGMVFATFSASASDSSLTYPDDSQRAAEDDYYIQYFGPALCAQRLFAEGRFRVAGQIGGGMFFYRNETTKGPFPGISDAFGPGAHVSASLDYRLFSRFAVGGGVRALYGKTPHLRYNAIDAELPAVSLSRVDLVAGIRFYP